MDDSYCRPKKSLCCYLIMLSWLKTLINEPAKIIRPLAYFKVCFQSTLTNNRSYWNRLMKSSHVNFSFANLLPFTHHSTPDLQYNNLQFRSEATYFSVVIALFIAHLIYICPLLVVPSGNNHPCGLKLTADCKQKVSHWVCSYASLTVWKYCC